jgi:phosphatidate cytidylyltransferase
MADIPTPLAQSKTLVFVRRSASTLALWALVTTIFISGKSWGTLGLIGCLAMVATIEYFKMMRVAGVKCFPRFGIILAALYGGVLYWHLQKGRTPPPDIDSFCVFLAAAVPFALQLRFPIRGLETLQAVAVNLLGFVYIALLFNFTARVPFLAPGVNELPGLVGNSGAFLLLWLLAVTKFTDMGAYIVGSMIGRHKMIPLVSPGKTWEGFGGALLFSQLAACGLFALFPQHLGVFHHWGHVIFLGFLLSILAVIGDLAESVLKRAVQAKDSGSILPGIGGSLDLIDSICFTAPALYFYLKWVLLPAA